MNGLSILDETYKDYLVAPTDNRVTLWISKVNGQSHSRPSRWRSHPCRRWGIQVHPVSW